LASAPRDVVRSPPQDACAVVLEMLGRMPDLSNPERLAVAAASLSFGAPTQNVGALLGTAAEPGFNSIWHFFAVRLALVSGKASDFARAGCHSPEAAAALASGSGDALDLLLRGLPGEVLGSADYHAERLALLVLAAERADWVSAAEGFSHSNDDGHLLAAHLFADRCGQGERARQLLVQTAKRDVLGAELLFDIPPATAGIGGLIVVESLEARAEALAAAGDVSASRAATEAILAVMGGEQESAAAMVSSSDIGGSEVERWRALQMLIARRRANGEPKALRALYQQAKNSKTEGDDPVGDPLRHAWNLRLAQLSMTIGAEPHLTTKAATSGSTLEGYLYLVYLVEQQRWEQVVKVWLALARTAEERNRVLLWIGCWCERRPATREAFQRHLREIAPLPPVAVALLTSSEATDSLAVRVPQAALSDNEQKYARVLSKVLQGRALSSRSQSEAGLLQVLQQVALLTRARTEEVAVLSRLLEFLGQRGHKHLQVPVLEALASQSESQSASYRQTLLQLGQLHRELGSSGLLLRLVTRLAEHAATDEEVLAFCEDVLREHGEGLFLLSVYKKRIELLQSEGRSSELVEVLARQAGVELELVGDAGAAARSFKRVLEHSPGNREALAGLERVMAGAGQLDLAAIYESEAERVGRPNRAAELLERAATLLREQGRLAAANRLFERAYDADPTNPGAFRALEQRLAKESAHRQRISLWLNRAEHLSDTRERAQAYFRAAEIQEEAGEIEQALGIYKKAFALTSSDVRVVSALVRLYEAFERWEEFLQVVDVQITLTRDAEEKAKLHFKYGSVLESVFTNLDGAKERYEEARSVFPDCLPALHGLRDLAMRRDDWPEVVRTLERELPLWKAAQGQASIHAHIGRIYNEKLNDRRRALDHFKKAITLDKGCAPAALSLFYLYADAGRHSSAAGWGEVCLRGSALRRAGAEEADFYARYAGVLADSGQCQRAVEVLECAIDARVLDERGLWVLLAISRERPEAVRNSDLVARCENLLSNDSRAKGILSACLGMIAKASGDLEKALRAYRAAVSALGTRFDIVEPFANLLVVIGEHEEAVRLVEACADDRESETWDKSMQWLVDHEILRRRRPKAALALLETLFDATGRWKTALQASRVCSLAGDWPRAVHFAEAAVRAAEEVDIQGPTLAPLLQRRGVARWGNGDAAGAEADWRQAVELSPAWAATYAASAYKRAQQGDHSGAMRDLKLAEQSVDPAEIPRIQCLQAQVSKHAGLVERAEVLFRKASRSGDFVEARMNLARMQSKSGRVDDAVSGLLQLLDQDASDVRIYGLLREVWTFVGAEDEAKRAAQIIANATGQTDQRQPRDVMRLSLRRGSWERLSGELTTGLLGRLYKVFCDEMCTQSTELPSSAVPADAEAERVLQLLAPMFGVKATVYVCRQAAPLTIRGQAVLLNEQLALTAQELRPLMVSGLVGMRLGQQPLIGARASELKEFARRMSTLLDPSVAESSALSRKARRTIGSMMKQVETEGVPSLEAWILESSRLRARMALLFSGDFDATMKMLALQSGYLACGVRESVPFSLVPLGRELAAYYVSSRYSEELQLLR
jgi:tetratricopeptide (TPR) repeat protein